MSPQQKIFGGTVPEEQPFKLTNLLVLGQGAPNTPKSLNHQRATCVALWSETDNKYYRIYPVPCGIVGDWDYIDVEVIKSKTDTRKDSFKVYNSDKEWPKIRIKVLSKKISREEKIELVKKLATETISKAEKERANFAIIDPKETNFIIEQRKSEEIDKNQHKLSDYSEIGEDLDQDPQNQKAYPWRIKLGYTCKGDCFCQKTKPHRQTIVEWGAYEWMRKNSKDKDHCKKLEDNYRLKNKEWKHWLLVGNQKLHPHKYLVVKIIRFKTN